MHCPIHSFYHKKFKEDFGVIRLSKFHSSRGWHVECSLWPTSGGRQFLQVPFGFEKKGWLVSWEMISDFLKKQGAISRLGIEVFFMLDEEKLKLDQIVVADNQGLPSSVESTQINSVLPQFIDHLKVNRILSTSEILSFWVRKEREVSTPNLNSLLVVSRLIVNYPWRDVKSTLEMYFESKVLITPCWMTRL